MQIHIQIMITGYWNRVRGMEKVKWTFCLFVHLFTGSNIHNWKQTVKVKWVEIYSHKYKDTHLEKDNEVATTVTSVCLKIVTINYHYYCYYYHLNKSRIHIMSTFLSAMA